jgi:hypothetical protein
MQVSFSRILVRGFCPVEGLCVPVVIGDVALEGVFQVGNGFQDAAPDTPSRDAGQKAPTAFRTPCLENFYYIF